MKYNVPLSQEIMSIYAGSTILNFELVYKIGIKEEYLNIFCVKTKELIGRVLNVNNINNPMNFISNRACTEEHELEILRLKSMIINRIIETNTSNSANPIETNLNSSNPNQTVNLSLDKAELQSLYNVLETALGLLDPSSHEQTSDQNAAQYNNQVELLNLIDKLIAVREELN